MEMMTRALSEIHVFKHLVGYTKKYREHGQKSGEKRSDNIDIGERMVQNRQEV
jgi:hypothetical protein